MNDLFNEEIVSSATSFFRLLDTNYGFLQYFSGKERYWAKRIDASEHTYYFNLVRDADEIFDSLSQEQKIIYVFNLDVIEAEAIRLDNDSV